MPHDTLAGTLAGLGAGIVLLVVAAVLLLKPEDTSAKVLVAVWLWSLPVLGFCAGIGWLIGRTVSRVKP